MTLIPFVNFHPGIKWSEYIYTSTIISVFIHSLQKHALIIFHFTYHITYCENLLKGWVLHEY